MWVLAAETMVTPLMPTFTGTDELVVDPSPSLPRSLDPQQRSPPEPDHADVCDAPALTPMASVIPDTATGVSAADVVPSPS